jgi:KaiC/GvpD/RAD55 family RecA-like ATPase
MSELKGANGPDELEVFLNSESRSLLVKGLAGTGKTTLALELMRRFGKAKGVYLSTRLPNKKVKEQIPWSAAVLGKDGHFHDLRMGSAPTFVEDFIDSLRGDDAPAIVVLDSWDAIAKELSEPERLKAEKSLLAMADNSAARVVFVSEEPNRTTMDYLVDGVVELSRTEVGERIFREIEIQKLRGTPIKQHKYLFTLADGRFGLIPPYSTPVYAVVRKAKPIQDLEERYSFGSAAMDRVFGGLRKGGIFTFEYTEKVPYASIRSLGLPPIVNFLQLGRSVLLIPLAGADPREDVSLVSRSTIDWSGKGVEGRFKVLAHSESQWIDPQMRVRTMDTVQDQWKEILQAITELRRNSIDHNVLIVECLSYLENKFATDVNSLLQSISTWLALTQGSSDALVILMQSDSTIRTRVLAMSYDYAKLSTKNRSVVMTGEKQNSGLYAVQHEEGRLPPALLPIV